jgi:hypothetical protein
LPLSALPSKIKKCVSFPDENMADGAVVRGKQCVPKEVRQAYESELSNLELVACRSKSSTLLLNKTTAKIFLEQIMHCVCYVHWTKNILLTCTSSATVAPILPTTKGAFSPTTIPFVLLWLED